MSGIAHAIFLSINEPLFSLATLANNMLAGHFVFQILTGNSAWDTKPLMRYYPMLFVMYAVIIPDLDTFRTALPFAYNM